MYFVTCPHVFVDWWWVKAIRLQRLTRQPSWNPEGRRCTETEREYLEGGREGRVKRGTHVCKKQRNRDSGREGSYVSKRKHDPAVKPGCGAIFSFCCHVPGMCMAEGDTHNHRPTHTHIYNRFSAGHALLHMCVCVCVQFDGSFRDVI